MLRIRRKLFTEEFWYSFGLFVSGIAVTIAANMRLKIVGQWLQIHHPHFAIVGRPIGTSIGTAVLATGLVYLTDIFFGYRFFKNRVEAFERFWGQEFGNSSEPGAIILQSDRIESLLQQLGREQLIDELSKPYRQDHTVNRFCKARNWINTFDAQGAKYIRETFLTQGFKAPDLEAIGRKQGNSKSVVRSERHLDIYMGLGHTEGITEIVNDVCEELKIEIHDVHGDAVYVSRSLFRKLPAGLFEPNANGADLVPLVREGWSHSDYVDEKLTNSYAFIFRYRQRKNRVIFHVGGFTDDSTAAAGKFLAEKWPSLYKDYFKDPKSDGNFFVLLTGTIPFGSEAPSWQKARGKLLANVEASNSLPKPRRQST